MPPADDEHYFAAYEKEDPLPLEPTRTEPDEWAAPVKKKGGKKKKAAGKKYAEDTWEREVVRENESVRGDAGEGGHVHVSEDVRWDAEEGAPGSHWAPLGDVDSAPPIFEDVGLGHGYGDDEHRAAEQFPSDADVGRELDAPAPELGVEESARSPASPSPASASPVLHMVAVSSPRAVPVAPAPPSAAPSSKSPQPRPATLYGSPSQYGLGPRPRVNSNTTQAKPRRESFPAHVSPKPGSVEPIAPPHKAQPHFYGLPDFGLNFGEKKSAAGGKLAGSDDYCCCFDSFADSGDAASAKKAKDALLVGSEGGLEVFRVLHDKFEVVGRLEGLRGSVIGAKILPHVDLFDAFQEYRPLVAVILHGVISEDPDTQSESIGRYQTTVEIYSLRNQQHITTLYTSASVAAEQPTLGQLSSLPGPIGDLTITARGRYVVVASGKSGEVFVFSSATSVVNPEPGFRCLGKFWTALQSSVSASRPGSSTEGVQISDEQSDKPGIPLFSLSPRWLAFVPPSTSSHVSIQGSPLLSEQEYSPPGLATHVALSQPAITCDVVGVDEEDAFSRLTRQAAQGIVKYSHKGYELSRQGWKELTNPTPVGQSGSHGRSSSNDYQFPPNKALPDDPRRFAREPAVVSIVDLDTLLEGEGMKSKYPPAPLATFALVEGCNYLSFSSNGLRLLTVGRKGEISTIWDLTQANCGSTKHSLDEGETGNGPCIRQVTRIIRNSHSVVIDSAWSRDDDCLAMLTTHGTVHLHEVPARAPSRKRKRRDTITSTPPDKADATVGVSHGMSPPSGNGFLGSLKSGWQQVSTQVNTIRSQNPVSTLGIPTSFAGIREVTASAGSAGTRALAKTVTQGLSAAKGGASDYWHADDNKIKHKALQDQDGAASIRWIRRRSETALAIVCGGTVHLHPVQRVERRKGDALIPGLKHDRYGRKQFALPTIRTKGDTSGTQAKKTDDCTSEGPHGFWSLRLAPSGEQLQRKPSPKRSLAETEFETNPPYCPFHVDSRVDISAFDDTTTGSQAYSDDTSFHLHGHGLADEEAWMFAQPLPSATKMNTHDYLDTYPVEVESEEGGDEDPDGLAEQVESKLTVVNADDEREEQIRINTRPAKVRRGDGGENEFSAPVDDFDGEL